MPCFIVLYRYCVSFTNLKVYSNTISKSLLAPCFQQYLMTVSLCYIFYNSHNILNSLLLYLLDDLIYGWCSLMVLL